MGRLAWLACRVLKGLWVAVIGVEGVVVVVALVFVSVLLFFCSSKL